MGKLEKITKKIKRELNNENFEVIKECFKKIDNEKIMKELKEQKIVNQIAEKHDLSLIYDEYLKLIVNINNINVDQEIAYLDFIIVI